MNANFNNFKIFLRKIKKIVSFFKIDFSFFLIFALAFILEEISLYFMFVIFVCLHELIHFFVAKKLGYMASKIHLTFFGASLEGLDDFSLKDEIKIVLAGPMFNFCVIVFCYLCFWFYPESYHYLNEILLANWAIFLFNMLPIFPLDFGRLLLTFFTKTKTRKDALKTTKMISIIFISILFLIYLISFFYELNFTLGFVCVNLTSLLLSSSKNTSFKRSVFVKRKFKLLSRGLLERNVYLKANTPNFSVFKFIDDYHFVNFVYVDEKLEIVDKKSEIEIYQELNLL